MSTLRLGLANRGIFVRSVPHVSQLTTRASDARGRNVPVGCGSATPDRPIGARTVACFAGQRAMSAVRASTGAGCARALGTQRSAGSTQRHRCRRGGRQAAGFPEPAGPAAVRSAHRKCWPSGGQSSSPWSPGRGPRASPGCSAARARPQIPPAPARGQHACAHRPRRGLPRCAGRIAPHRSSSSAASSVSVTPSARAPLTVRQRAPTTRVGMPGVIRGLLVWSPSACAPVSTSMLRSSRIPLGGLRPRLEGSVCVAEARAGFLTRLGAPRPGSPRP